MASNPSTARTTQLAITISESVEKTNRILSTLGIPFPSFQENAPTTFPKEVSDARDAVLDATAELHDLLLEPLSLLYRHNGHNNPVSMQTIAHFNIASIVPLGGRISFAEIAKHTGVLSEDTVRRLLRHAMTMRVFCEPEPGLVAHTAVSRTLATPMMNDWLRIGTEEMWPAATKMLDALQKWPDSSEPNETAFALSNNTTESIYSIIGKDPERALRFASAMRAFATQSEYDASHIVDSYGWASLGSAKIVDIGGSQGHVATELARRYESLHIVVQDIPELIQSTDLAAALPTELSDRIEYMAHDFFTPQTIQADVFYFRRIFHNWSDKYCDMILRALIPVLKVGSRIIIEDICMPEMQESLPLWREKLLRSEDLNMCAIFNSRERSAGEWKDLLAIADPRFILNDIIQPQGSALAIIDVRWDDSIQARD